jgi:hypothetical protein
MPSSEDSRSQSVHVMAPHRWRSARILEAVCQVNEHLVSALSELSRCESHQSPIVGQNREALRRLDVTACKRVARIPVLLVDLHFQRIDWWRNVARANGGNLATSTLASNLPATHAAELTREALIVAWLAVQHARQSMGMLFGMSDMVASLIGEMTPQQINRIAERSSRELRIRWQTKPEFWRRLLMAGQSGSAVELCEVQLLGLQLLGGELISAR